jgi:protein-disulfide isomerase
VGLSRLRAAALVTALACCSTTGCGGDDAHSPAPRLAGASTLSQRFRGIEQHGRVLGAPAAPYTLVMFADLQCPFCAAFDRDVLPSVIEDYVRPGKLKIQLRLVAFLGPDSGTAAAAGAAAALQDRGWQFADLVYRNQGRENSGYFTPQYVGAIAKAIDGLDGQSFVRSSGSRALLARLEDDRRAARTVGVRSTPTFLVGRSAGALTLLRPASYERTVFLAALRRGMAQGGEEG